jgi:hypothetical protein
MVYQIRVKGELDQSWGNWLGDVRLSCETEDDGSVITTLTADFADQPALFGALDRIRDLNLVLISVLPSRESQNPSGART